MSPGASSIAQACSTIWSGSNTLFSAIEAAGAIVYDPSATPQEVTAAVQALQSPVYGFRDQLQVASGQTTDVGLKAAIALLVSEIPAVAAAAATGDFDAFFNAMAATSGDDQISVICDF
jgi:hypothetical protein